MRFVKRAGPVPVSLQDSASNRRRRTLLDFIQLEPLERAQTKVPKLDDFHHTDVMDRLNEIFRNKCAFCECKVATGLYRLRPAHDTQPSSGPDGHIYYAWLFDAWQNLFPICDECRPKEYLLFPVEQDRRASVPTAEEYQQFLDSNSGVWPGYPLAEKALILDPCAIETIGVHLRPRPDGFIDAPTPIGDATVRHFDLNRAKLRKLRRQAFSRFRNATAEVGDHEEFVGLWRIYTERSASKEGKSLRTPLNARHRGTTNAEPIVRSPLVRVDIANFKALEDISFDMPAPPPPTDRIAQALVLLGENAAGKSAVLEAIALATSEVATRDHLIPNPGKLRLHPAYLGAPDLKRRPSASVRLTFANSQHRRMEVIGQKYNDTGKALSPLIFAYGAYRHFLPDDSVPRQHGPVVNLFQSGRALPDPEPWLLALQPDPFNEVIRALREIFGATEKFNVIERGDGRCFVVTEVDETLTQRTPLQEVSSGFRTILALACDIIRWLMNPKINPDYRSLTEASGIILIDEIEAHLHPRWKIHIMTGLRKAFPGMTIIATTHDPLCLRGMRLGEVMVLNRVRSERSPRAIPLQSEIVTEFPDVSQFTIEQLLTSDLFSLYTTDDTRMQETIAGLADHLSTGVDEGGRKTMDPDVARQVLDQLSTSLPVGLGEAGRIAQRALAKYLNDRRNMPHELRKALRTETIDAIYSTLKDLQ